jgi:hypothetical protein
MLRVLRFGYLTLLVSAPVAAQLVRGTIAGTVTDPLGAAVPGVHVLVGNVATGLTLTKPGRAVQGDGRSGRRLRGEDRCAGFRL